MNWDKDEIRDVVKRVVEERLGASNDLSSSRPAPEHPDEPQYRGRQLITEQDVMTAHRSNRALTLQQGAILTPLARDSIDRYQVPVTTETGNEESVDAVQQGTSRGKPEKACEKGLVAIASDHGGFEMKQLLVRFIEDEVGIPCEDLGTHSTDAVDYPDYARLVADSVTSGECCRGIVVDGAGVGSAMAANKMKGVRAAHCSNVVEARNAREHNDANVLTVGGRMIGYELAKAITVVFLKTDFEGGRHQDRIDKIMDLEE